MLKLMSLQYPKSSKCISRCIDSLFSSLEQVVLKERKKSVLLCVQCEKATHITHLQPLVPSSS